MRHGLALMAAAALAVGSGGLPAAQSANPARFHHVHLNSTDLERTFQFYQKVFGALPVKYGGTTDALFTGRGFIFASKVDAPPRPIERTAVRHIGWAGVDGPNEFAWWKTQGVEFHTPLTPLGQNWFFYMWGPDREVVEIYTGAKNHWFNHVHLSTDDPGAAAKWYAQHLGQAFPRGTDVPRPAEPGRVWSASFTVDGVNFILVHKNSYYAESETRLPPDRTLETSQSSPIDHFAFSYTDIDAAFERMRAAGVRIVDPIRPRAGFGFRSFLVMGPDGVLIEVVEAKPIPDALW